MVQDRMLIVHRVGSSGLGGQEERRKEQRYIDFYDLLTDE